MLLYNRLHGALFCLIQALTKLKTLTYHRYERALSVLNVRSYFYLIIAFLFHVLPFKASAQVAEPVADSKAVDLTSLGLQIGEQVPDLTLINVHNYKSTSINLSDFKGKLLILDFWATWCSPCVAMIPKMDSLQKEFGDKVQFLSVTYQKAEEAIPFLSTLEKRQGQKYDLPVVTGDSALKNLFPHKSLPHYVWIDSNGAVKAITSFEDITRSNLSNIVDGQEIPLGEKKDISIAYDWKDPLFFDESSAKFPITQYAVFSGYIEGLSPGYYNTQPIKNDKVPLRITARNQTIPQLYQIAMGKGYTFDWKHTLLQVSEPERIIEFDKNGEAYLSSLRDGRGFCYEIVAPRASGMDLYDMMANDLAKFFPKHSATVQDVTQPCMALRQLPGADFNRLRTKGKSPSIETDERNILITNYTFNALVNQLNFYHSKERTSGVQDIFFFNETGFTEKVDLDITAGLGDLPLLNRELEKIGLVLVSEDRPIKMLVINDRP